MPNPWHTAACLIARSPRRAIVAEAERLNDFLDTKVVVAFEAD